mgnify:CR=1 FL=1|tara:strand:- start:247 stop:480 length:234 start_codon:yes stop_codon:yes gene_type:complete
MNVDEQHLFTTSMSEIYMETDKYFIKKYFKDAESYERFLSLMVQHFNRRKSWPDTFEWEQLELPFDDTTDVITDREK